MKWTMENGGWKMAFAVFVFAALLVSCNTDELCYLHPHPMNVCLRLELDLDTEYDEDRAHDDITHFKVHFFEHYTHDAAQTVEVPLGISEISLVEGHYDLVAHSDNDEWTTYEDHDLYESHSALTRDADLLEPLFGTYDHGHDHSHFIHDPNSSSRASSIDLGNGQRVAAEPEPIWGGGLNDRAIHPGDTVTVTVHPLHSIYTFEMIDVGPTDKVKALGAFITGMAGGTIIATGEHVDDVVTIPVEAWIDNETNSIKGEFYTYGHHKTLANTHRMGLFVLMEDGKGYSFIEGDYLDVTEQIHTAPDQRHVHIEIRGIRIPDPDKPIGPDNPSGGGFGAKVDEWQTENFDIKM